MILRVDVLQMGGRLKSVIFLAVVFFLSVSRASWTCQKFEKPKAYLAMREDVDNKIREFANRKEIAVVADKTLSKLLQAKSPIVLNWIQSRNLDVSQEEEVVKAWRLYYAQAFILSKYPHKDSKLNAQIERLVDQSLAKHFKPGFRKKLDRLFAQAKAAALETIEGFQLKETPQLLSRVRAIRLYWPENLKSARNQSLPLDLISWGVAYDPTANEINVGLEALFYPNDNSFLSVFAHEIGHSFDSCRWGAYFEGPWPFEEVGECLRSSESVGAKKRDDSKLEDMVKSGAISADLATSLKMNSTCNKLVYPPSGVQADQLPESFADWFSAEVVAHLAIKDLTGFRSDLCEDKDLSVGSSYPTHSDRLEKIYFANKKLYEKLPERQKLELKKNIPRKQCQLKTPASKSI